MEQCFGCDAEAEEHPIVAVMHSADVMAVRGEDEDAIVGGQVNKRGFVGVPICRACHVEPTHRTRVVKGSFFGRDQAPIAIMRGGSNNLTVNESV